MRAAPIGESTAPELQLLTGEVWCAMSPGTTSKSPGFFNERLLDFGLLMSPRFLAVNLSRLIERLSCEE